MTSLSHQGSLSHPSQMDIGIQKFQPNLDSLSQKLSKQAVQLSVPSFLIVKKHIACDGTRCDGNSSWFGGYVDLGHGVEDDDSIHMTKYALALMVVV